MDNITSFVKSLVKKVGITDPKLQQETIENLEPVLMDRIIVSLISKLSENQQVEVVNFINQTDWESAVKCLKKNIPDFDKVYEKILVDFGNEYIKGMEE